MLKNANVWIDGFDTFTPQEFSIVKELVIVLVASTALYYVLKNWKNESNKKEEKK